MKKKVVRKSVLKKTPFKATDSTQLFLLAFITVGLLVFISGNMGFPPSAIALKLVSGSVMR